MPTQTKQDVERFLSSFHQDVNFFKQHLPEMLRQYPEQFVAIHDGEIVDHDENWERLTRRIRQRFVDTYVLVERVVQKVECVVDMDTIES